MLALCFHFHTTYLIHFLSFIFLYLPVCSAADLYGSTDRGEHWQQLALASSHSWPVSPLSYSHFFLLSTSKNRQKKCV